jgi:hypothetical protein
MKHSEPESFRDTRRYHIIRWFVSLGTAVSLAGTGVVYAAQGSTPGSTLYPLKVASEQVAVTLSPTKKIKTEVMTTIIDRRASEIAHLEDAHKKRDIPKALDAYEKTVKNATRAAHISLPDVDAHVEEHKTYISDVKKRTEETKETQKEEKEKQNDAKENKFFIAPTSMPESLPVEVHISPDLKKDHENTSEIEKE